MTTVTATASAATGTSLQSTTPTRTPKQAFDSDMFMQLLVTQMRNQDPSSPMDSTQMVQQTSQLASMEQLTSLSKTSTEGYSLQQRAAAANILGKTVTWTDAAGAPQSGVASSVSFSGGDPVITVGSQTVKLTELTGVTSS